MSVPRTARAALDDLDVAVVGLEHMAGEPGELVAQRRGGELAGAARDHHRAAGEGAPAIRRPIGVAMDDADLRRLDAELVGDQLGERRRQALAVRRGADPRLDVAGRVHA